MGRRIVAVAVTLACVAGLVAVETPATAAPPAIELSRDGVVWGSSLSPSLFGDLRLIPTGSGTRAFYIRNNAPEAGFLRLTLRDVSTDNLDYAGALSLRADLTGWPGEAVPVSAARPCARLAEGPVIGPGDTARVDMTALLGQLEGLHGQNGHVDFQVVVSVSGEPLGLGSTGCPTTGEAVAGVDPFVASGAAGYSRTYAAQRYDSTAAGWIPWNGIASSSGTPLTPSDPTVTTPTTATGLRVSANTDRFYQEYDAALWLIGALLGVLGAVLLRRHPKRAAPETGTRPKGALR